MVSFQKMYNIPEEVNQALESYLACFDSETGEQLQEDEVVKKLEKELNDLQNKQGEIQEWACKKYKEKEVSIENIKSEIKRLKAFLENREKDLERMEKFVQHMCKP